MPLCATPEGTRRYAQRFAGRAAAGHFRELPGATGLLLSSLRIGTYLGDADTRTDQGYTDAVVAAVTAGVNVIDSSINYRFQRSERSIRAALHQLAQLGMSATKSFCAPKADSLRPTV